ncbi:MAG: DUF4919 domain-containing protein [Flavobacteriales bacterium]
MSQSAYGISFDSLKSAIEADSNAYLSVARRYASMDTTLSFNEMFALYYGSAYMPGYSPYSDGMDSRVVEGFMEEKKYEEALSMCRSQISKSPSTTVHYLNLGWILSTMGDSVNAQIAYDQYYSLLSIPYRSGDGSSYKDAMVVRSVNDEYMILNAIGYRMSSQALIHNKGIPFDQMTCLNRDNPDEEKVFYFNIYQPFSIGMMSMFGGSESGKSKKKRDRSNKKRTQRGD